MTQHHGMTALDRFWLFVDASGGLDACWIWTGAHNQGGYGIFYADGRSWVAHRYLLTSITGSSDASMRATHRCDNPPCVNPIHVRWATQGANIREMDERGRRPRKYTVEKA